MLRTRLEFDVILHMLIGRKCSDDMRKSHKQAANQAWSAEEMKDCLYYEERISTSNPALNDRYIY